jgi:putative ABC transport system permease protein
MLLKVAWRNIWRNKRRSVIILCSIIIGVAALLIYNSLVEAFGRQMLKNQIESNISHIQIHKEGFEEDNQIQKTVPDPNKISKILENSAFVKHFSKRIVATGMITSANNSTGASILGIEPQKEQHITFIKDFIVEGKYVSEDNDIVIGKELADKLEVGLDDKIVLMAAAMDGSVSSALFRISGLFHTGNGQIDKMYAYILLPAAQKMLGMEDEISEFAIKVNELEKVTENRDELILSINEIAGENVYEVLSYRDLIPLIVYYVESIQEYMVVVYIIIIIAILFGVINAMLMSVFERIQEFGVLMSLGMSRFKVFMMIMQEALILSLLGSIIGFAFGGLLLLPMMGGLDLSIWSEGLSSFGVGSIIYPKFSVDLALNALLIMPISTVVGALYPALRAIKLQPTDAMRYV